MKIIRTVFLFTGLSGTGFTGWASTFDAVIDLPPRIELSLPVSGIVSKVTVSAGQQVKKGELLIALDDRPFRADRDLVQSRVDFHQARLDESGRDLKHQQELYDRTVLSTVDLENAQLRVKRDRAMLASARAKLARADYALSNSRLLAPFDATILDVQVNEGQAISNAIQAKTLLSLIRKGAYTAVFGIRSEQLGKLSIDTPVTVVIGDKRFPAKISAIDYGALTPTGVEKQFSATATFSMEADFSVVGNKASVQTE